MPYPTSIRLLGGGAAQGLVQARAAVFKSRTGTQIDGSFGPVGVMKARILGGEPVDVAILTQNLMHELAHAGHVVEDSLLDLGVVHTAIAARQSDRKPAIGTTDQLRAALLAAPAIYFPDAAQATAGVHFSRVIDQLGLRQALATRVRILRDGLTAMAVLAKAGEPGALGCTQATEILATPAITLVGPLPAETGLATIYTAGVCTRAQSPDAARSFVDLLVDLGGMEAFGFERISASAR